MVQDDLSSLMRYVLENYPATLKTHALPGKQLPVCSGLLSIASLLGEACAGKGHDHVEVKASWGLGRWNPTPWIAFLDERITETTREAFYPVFLFRADGTGVYLSLDLGTGRAKGSPTGREVSELRAQADQLSGFFRSLRALGFNHAPAVDLRRPVGVAVGFAAGSIVHKFYAVEQLPDSGKLLKDVESAIKEYERFTSSEELMGLFHLIRRGEVDPVIASARDLEGGGKGGQGYLKDSKLRQLIEQHAMRRAADHFQDLGYTVQDVHLKKPYDLRCVNSKEILTVEVKGTRSNGGTVVLTQGEVTHARGNAPNSVLFLCSGIQLQTNDKGELEARGGSVSIFRPWSPEQSLLTPVGYWYKVPGAQNPSQR